MQTSRIKSGEYYQTKKGVGKCLSTAGKRLKFQIDGKEHWLSSSEVQHEIAPDAGILRFSDKTTHTSATIA